MIDIHCHLLPGIDDGCEDAPRSLEAIRRMMAAGFVGAVCTPHVWYELFPANTPASIVAHTMGLQRIVDEAGLRFRLWPGGEVRLHKNVADDFDRHGVPTLAGSRCVLADIWFDKWPRWLPKVIAWLIDHKYQPILAHPERINCPRDLPKQLDELATMGVWFQGNFRCLTGEEGYHADQLVRRFLHEQRYRFMATDLHRPASMESRFDGLALLAAQFSEATLRELTDENPRKLIVEAPRA